jgi:hypothetical protein
MADQDRRKLQVLIARSPTQKSPPSQQWGGGFLLEHRRRFDALLAALAACAPLFETAGIAKASAPPRNKIPNVGNFRSRFAGKLGS